LSSTRPSPSCRYIQRAKRRASTNLSNGDSAAALREIRDAQQLNSAAQAAAPAELAEDLAEEAQVLDYLAREIENGQLSRAAKYSSYDQAGKAGNSAAVIRPSQRQGGDQPGGSQPGGDRDQQN
jgi:Ca-activated chloride channel homolog